TGRTLTWTALLAGMMGKGSHRMFLEQSETMAKQGIAVVPQVSCRPLNFEFDLAEPFVFESMRIFNAIASEDHAGRMRAYRDPSFRAQLKEALAHPTAGVFSFSWERMVVSFYPPEPTLEEQRMDKLAAARGVDPTDLLLDLALATELKARFRMSVVNYDEDEVAELL